MNELDHLDSRLENAVRHFWTERTAQGARERDDEIVRNDRDGRDAVVGGKQMDGFIGLIFEILRESGIKSSMIFCSTRSGEDDIGEQPKPKTKRRNRSGGPQRTQTQLPGWFRAEKDWDLLVIINGTLVAAIEFKSQVGSFGNNFNNRTEEAIGNALDIKSAYREGAFKPSLRPWLGYLMLLEEAPKSMKSVKPAQPHFKVFEEFEQASYAQRYDILLTKLIGEELYDAACFLLSPRESGLEGKFVEPNLELNFRNFITSLVARASAVAQLHPAPAESAQLQTSTETRQ